ncbi:DUF4397 domain-containing protein [Pelomonas sp. SE-A7]|uniref:DUF4397 domain-containing protein n=1 Tax=Pelomonas sp. SE-A7 TaxID=3054953 RepID=UPI00259CD9B6|nr:DUF4397 domain-containing protein [Pelomonas sp. SE-A7]MDM4768529.1 DUF4397 domain-containing protein [Pelomonas sp. SE-A7]
MRFGSLATLVALVGSTLLAACGGGGGGSSSSNAQMRLINASVGYSSLDFTIGTTKTNTGVAYATAGTYADVNTGSTASQVQANGTGTTLVSISPTLTGGSKYSVIAYGWSGALRTTLLQEEEAVPTTAGTSKLLVLNEAADAGALDVYLTGATDSLDNASPMATGIVGGASSGYIGLNSGSFRVRVTGNGNRNDVRLDIPSISLEALKVHSLIITPTQGGVLVNGIFMQQQGNPTNYANNTARARVVASVANNAQVGSTSGGKTLLQNSVAPTIGDYLTLPAGSNAINTTVNGTAMAAANVNLTAGGDYTLMVWGDASAPQLVVFPDDNRLPTTAGTAKMRLINGVAGAPAGLTLTLDFSAIASTIVPGTVSSQLTVPASTSSQLSVTSPVSPTPLFKETGLTINQNGIYTVFVMGGGAVAPQGVLRRER